MKLSSILKKESILQIESGTNKQEIIHQLIGALEKNPFAAELPAELRSTFFEEIEKREQLGTTALGEGIALPHARIAGLERPLMAFATIKNGTDLGALDGQPTQFAFLILLPASRAELGVKINSACTRFLMSPGIRTQLLEASSPEAIQRIMDGAQFEIDAPIIALDLMRPARILLHPQQPIEEATQLMHRLRAAAAPVMGDGERIVGELNSAALFERELPDYIKKLHSVPNITDFSPFHDHFAKQTNLTVGDLMNDCKSTIDENGSLLEIVFLLSVKKYPLLYVCREGRLLGVIDSITVADKIFNM